MIEKYYYGYDEFRIDVNNLASKLKNENFEAIIGITRGGLLLTQFLAIKLNLRDVFTINSILYDDMIKKESGTVFNIPDLLNYKKVLIADDIIDSGETMKNILDILKDKFPNIEFKVASLFYKKTAIIQPDFIEKEATQWIDFFWEVD
ncbi:MAG: phosphoribosyltransferase [Epsilonproteobacteria bacterium]|nr:phosphoribosyltransferase [Campylobacterota bacterium]